jgi:hypothetical protein
MCDHAELESRNHLFFYCPFAKLCLQYLCLSWTPPHQQDIQNIITSLKHELKVLFFMELIILTTWAIWLIRNDFIFKGSTPNLYRCRKIFKEELALLVHKATRKSYLGLKAWVERFR